MVATSWLFRIIAGVGGELALGDEVCVDSDSQLGSTSVWSAMV